MKVLLTGITGFVGSHLLDYLKNRDDITIYGMVRDQNKYDKLKIKNLYAFVTLEEAMNRFNFDYIIHLAGKAHDIKNVSDKNDYHLSNVKLTQDLFDAFSRQKKEGCFIYISSVSVFSHGSNHPFTEDIDPDPLTAYGSSKFTAEKYIQSNPLANGKRYCILRPSIIYGPNSKGNLNLLFNMVKSGIPYPLGAFDNYRSFLSIHNFCYVINLLIGQNLPSGVYHIADDDVISTKEVVEIMYETLEKKKRIINIPRKLVEIVAKFGDYYPMSINTERLSKLTQNFIVSNKKLLQALDTDLPVKTREGLRDTFQHYIENN